MRSASLLTLVPWCQHAPARGAPSRLLARFLAENVSQSMRVNAGKVPCNLCKMHPKGTAYAGRAGQRAAWSKAVTAAERCSS